MGERWMRMDIQLIAYGALNFYRFDLALKWRTVFQMYK